MINTILEHLAHFGSNLEEWATRKIIQRKQVRKVLNRPLSITVPEND